MTDEAGLDGLTATFTSMVDEGLHPGAQLAVWKDGEPVVELAGGTRPDRKTPIEADTLFCVLSCTKALTALVVHTLHDRGVFSYEDTVASHWPAFADHGKEAITVGQVLSHRAGLCSPQVETYLQWPLWIEPDGARTLMEDFEPRFEPGDGSGYHAATFGHVLGELVLRWTGRDVGAVLAGEVLRPLGVTDVFIGLPETELDRVTPFVDHNPPAPPGFAYPPGGEGSFFNSYEVLRRCLPWSTGVATASALAQVMQVYAGEGSAAGHTFFSPATFARAVTPTRAHPDERDRLIPQVVWGSGLALAASDGIYGRGAGPRACGHAGGMAAVTFADPDTGLSAAFLCNNNLAWGDAWQRWVRMNDAVQAAVVSRQ